MADIFEYFDFRKFLRDEYENKRINNPTFSYRFISQRAGFNPSTFWRILQAKRNISQKVADKLSKVFKLNQKQTEYFLLLVLFNQAGNHRQKALYFEKLLQFRRAKIKSLAPHQFEIFSNWYYIAIREMLNHYELKDNFADMAKNLAPNVKPKEVKKAVLHMEQLGLVRRNEHGLYKPTDQFITTGDELSSVAIANFQAATMRLAEQAIDRFPKDERDITTLTISTSRQGLQIIKEKIRQLQREILEVENQIKDMDEVYQVNFQIFPLTYLSKRSKK